MNPPKPTVEPFQYPFFKWVAKCVPLVPLSARKFRISGTVHHAHALEEWGGWSRHMEGVVIVTKRGRRIGPLFMAWDDLALATERVGRAACHRCAGGSSRLITTAHAVRAGTSRRRPRTRS